MWISWLLFFYLAQPFLFSSPVDLLKSYNFKISQEDTTLAVTFYGGVRDKDNVDKDFHDRPLIIGYKKSEDFGTIQLIIENYEQCNYNTMCLCYEDLLTEVKDRYSSEFNEYYCGKKQSMLCYRNKGIIFNPLPSKDDARVGDINVNTDSVTFEVSSKSDASHLTQVKVNGDERKIPGFNISTSYDLSSKPGSNETYHYIRVLPTQIWPNSRFCVVTWKFPKGILLENLVDIPDVAQGLDNYPFILAENASMLPNETVF